MADVTAHALILARGNSRRLERKNLRHLGGVPLVVWPIRAAIRASAVTSIWVSTEDTEIAAVAKQAGAQIIDRPPELAGDFIGDWPCFHHALMHMGDLNLGPEDVIVHLRATGPFVRPEYIDAVVALFRNPKVESVRSVRVATEHPRKMYRAGPVLDGLPTLVPYTGERHAANEARQGLERVYRAAGVCDAARVRVIQKGYMDGSVVVGIEVGDLEYIDIDTEADWQEAEARVRFRKLRPGGFLGDKEYITR